VYNVCSGVGVTVRELAEAALARGGVEADIVSDSAFQRAADMPVLVGSPARLKSATGWAPTKDYRDIIDDLFTAAEAG
jgi:nucleoside-diphosphate-sugar epimerase